MNNENPGNRENTENLENTEKIPEAPPKIIYREIKKGNKKIIAFMLIAGIILGYVFGVISERVNIGNDIMQPQKIRKLNELVDEYYYFSNDIDFKKATENAFGAYMASFNDPFTYYLSEEDYKSMTESLTGNYVGIGVEVTVNDENYITITNSFENGPAREAGIEAGDLILEVEGIPYTGDTMEDAVMVLKGHINEPVKIKLFDFSENCEKEVTVIRKRVVAETVSSKILDNKIAYIKISSFGDTTYNEFKAAYDSLMEKNPEGMIIDLRNNSGGTLDAVVAVADLIMPEGVIAKIKYKSFPDETHSSDERCFQKKIVVLVNEYTASAAELLSGGLRDNNNATLVGKKTFGKGVVGTVLPVDSKSAAVITTGEYFLPKGDNIHKKGIMPDIEADLPETVRNIYLLEEREDTQLKRAVEEFK